MIETDAKTVIVNMVKALNEHLIDGKGWDDRGRELTE
jgi:hypothetical protein